MPNEPVLPRSSSDPQLHHIGTPTVPPGESSVPRPSETARRSSSAHSRSLHSQFDGGALTPRTSRSQTMAANPSQPEGIVTTSAAEASAASRSVQSLAPRRSPPSRPRSADFEMQRDGPTPAGTMAYFAMQNLRHAGPVAGMRTVTQGLAAPALARLVQSDPRAALGVQLALSIMAALRRGAAQWHSESQVDVANQAFSGDSTHRSSAARRAWQAAQTVVTTSGDVAATALTGLSITHPQLTPAAQAMASIQLRAHMLSMLREFLRPTINTVQVGNHGPHATWPAEGRNLRLEDIGALARLGFGTAAGALEFGSQIGMQLVLARGPAWTAAAGWATLAGLIAGAANMLSSSVEDHLIDSAVARRMQQSDPTHVKHVQFESRNPLTRRELSRQFERVDARVLNQMLPAMLAAAVMQGLQPLMQRHQVGAVGQVLAQAAVNALMTGLILGLLLAKTVQTYQLNDALREHRTRSQDTPT